MYDDSCLNCLGGWGGGGRSVSYWHHEAIYESEPDRACHAYNALLQRQERVRAETTNNYSPTHLVRPLPHTHACMHACSSHQLNISQKRPCPAAPRRMSDASPLASPPWLRFQSFKPILLPSKPPRLTLEQSQGPSRACQSRKPGGRSPSGLFYALRRSDVPAESKRKHTIYEI